LIVPAELSKLIDFNDDCTVETFPHNTRFEEIDVLAALADVSIVAEPTPSPLQLIFDACLARRRPLLWGCDAGEFGVLVSPNEAMATRCERCRLDSVRATDREAATHEMGGITSFWVGTQLAMATIAVMTGGDAPSTSGLWSYDVMAGEIQALRGDPEPCPHIDSAPSRFQ
jgi:hypothetical protein